MVGPWAAGEKAGGLFALILSDGWTRHAGSDSVVVVVVVASSSSVVGITTLCVVVVSWFLFNGKRLMLHSSSSSCSSGKGQHSKRIDESFQRSMLVSFNALTKQLNDRD